MRWWREGAAATASACGDGCDASRTGRISAVVSSTSTGRIPCCRAGILYSIALTSLHTRCWRARHTPTWRISIHTHSRASTLTPRHTRSLVLIHARQSRDGRDRWWRTSTSTWIPHIPLRVDIGTACAAIAMLHRHLIGTMHASRPLVSSWCVAITGTASRAFTLLAASHSRRRETSGTVPFFVVPATSGGGRRLTWERILIPSVLAARTSAGTNWRLAHGTEVALHSPISRRQGLLL